MSYLPLYQAEHVQTNPFSNLVSTADTVAKMIGLVKESITNPLCVSVAQQIMQGVGNPYGQDAGELDCIRGCFWWVKHHIHFKEDENALTQDFGVVDLETGKELLLSPPYLLSMPVPTGDCDDFSTLLATLLKIVGFQTVGFRTVAANEEDPEAFTHVYVVVMTANGGILPLDASHGSYPGWETKGIFKSKDWWIR